MLLVHPSVYSYHFISYYMFLTCFQCVDLVRYSLKVTLSVTNFPSTVFSLLVPTIRVRYVKIKVETFRMGVCANHWNFMNRKYLKLFHLRQVLQLVSASLHYRKVSEDGRIELPTTGLRDQCSTTELIHHI